MRACKSASGAGRDDRSNGYNKNKPRVELRSEVEVQRFKNVLTISERDVDFSKVDASRSDAALSDLSKVATTDDAEDDPK